MKKNYYAVFGNPIEHSRSPQIHQLFAQQQGIQLVYERILVPVGEFSQTFQQFVNSGGVGANVTVPFKSDAMSVCEVLSKRAQNAGAVNTLIRRDNVWIGDNTDGLGLVFDIQRIGINLSGSRILILGAGGAVRGVLLPLLEQEPSTIVICNRDLKKAQVLAEGKDVIQVASWDTLVEFGYFDVVINGTSASLSNTLLPVPDTIFQHALLAYDMVYADRPTVFLQQAQHAQTRYCVDGLGMLVAQASYSYHAWHGFIPSIEQVLKVLRV